MSIIKQALLTSISYLINNSFGDKNKRNVLN